MSEPRDTDELDEGESEPAPIPAIPADQPIIPNYMTGAGPRLVTLRRMTVMEAEMAKAKLEGEGIPCFVADTAMASMQPLVLTPATLQVQETDVLLATKILSRPAAADMEGEYAEENWRCPKCHRKTVELLPLSPGLRRARNMFFALIGAQIAGQLLRLGIPAGDELAAYDAAISWAFLPWLLAVFVFGLWWLLSKREKRCNECGHQWAGTAS